MSTETDILDAVKALGLFTTVRYVLAESDNSSAPIALPFFILGGARQDFATTKTFCGTALTLKSYDVTIAAQTASQAMDLLESVRGAISAIINVATSAVDYDDEAGFYFNNITLTTD